MPPTFKSVVVRSIIASALFLVFVSATGSGGGNAIVLFAFMFVFLLGFGYLFDKWLFKRRLARWERKRAGQ